MITECLRLLIAAGRLPNLPNFLPPLLPTSLPTLVIPGVPNTPGNHPMIQAFQEAYAYVHNDTPLAHPGLQLMLAGIDYSSTGELMQVLTDLIESATTARDINVQFDEEDPELEDDPEPNIVPVDVFDLYVMQGFPHTPPRYNSITHFSFHDTDLMDFEEEDSNHCCFMINFDEEDLDDNDVDDASVIFLEVAPVQPPMVIDLTGDEPDQPPPVPAELPMVAPPPANDNDSASIETQDILITRYSDISTYLWTPGNPTTRIDALDQEQSFHRAWPLTLVQLMSLYTPSHIDLEFLHLQAPRTVPFTDGRYEMDPGLPLPWFDFLVRDILRHNATLHTIGAPLAYRHDNFQNGFHRRDEQYRTFIDFHLRQSPYLWQLLWTRDVPLSYPLTDPTVQHNHYNTPSHNPQRDFERVDPSPYLPTNLRTIITTRRAQLRRRAYFATQWIHCVDSTGDYDHILVMAITIWNHDQGTQSEMSRFMQNFRAWRLWRLELPMVNVVNHLRMLDRAYESQFDGSLPRYAGWTPPPSGPIPLAGLHDPPLPPAGLSEWGTFHRMETDYHPFEDHPFHHGVAIAPNPHLGQGQAQAGAMV